MLAGWLAGGLKSPSCPAHLACLPGSLQDAIHQCAASALSSLANPVVLAAGSWPGVHRLLRRLQEKVGG